MEPAPEYLTADEYARLTRRSLRTIERERASGKGCPWVQIGARVLYPRQDVFEYIQAHCRTTTGEPETHIDRATS